jgi:hypothetical protein
VLTQKEEEHAMSNSALIKMFGSGLAASFAVAVFAFSLGTDSAVAAGYHPPAPLYDYAGVARGWHGVPSSAPRYVDGYLYAPGRGIVGEACMMPTSACSDGVRPN